MNDEVYIKEISHRDCKPELLMYFNRYQSSSRNWHKHSGQWVLCDELFIEDWDDIKKAQVISDLASCINNGGCVLGVYNQNRLIGFASVHADFFGSKQQYVELSYMHISNGFRGKGMGKTLFSKICGWAHRKKAKKLYISANPAEDSIAFYRKIGCVDACEINQKIQERCPDDCQLEYDLICSMQPVSDH